MNGIEKGMKSGYGRYLVGIQYHGGRYSGWSNQEPTKRVFPGIVYILHEKLQKFMDNRYTNLIGSSRTDAGVHAIRNTFHIDVDVEAFNPVMTPDRFIRGLNTYLLKDDIHILDCQRVPLEFDCRRNATSRTYTYRLMSTTKNLKLSKQWLFQDSNIWYVKNLNIKAMKEAAQHLIGIHDFTTFRNRDCQSQSTFRHIWRLDIDRYNFSESQIHDPFLIGPHELITITITGNAFLYRMVRNIVGTLVAVGHGEISPDDIPRLLEARDRLLIPPLAPPNGLHLVNVTYNDEDMICPILPS